MLRQEQFVQAVKRDLTCSEYLTVKGFCDQCAELTALRTGSSGMISRRTLGSFVDILRPCRATWLDRFYNSLVDICEKDKQDARFFLTIYFN